MENKRVKISRIAVKTAALTLCILLALPLASCLDLRNKYDTQFLDTFDTVVSVSAFSRNKKTFDRHMALIHDELIRLNKLFDIYNNYEGINNLKTVNDNAGIAPVAVEQDIIELLVFGKQCYEKSNGTVNITMGSVLKIWHDYRDEGLKVPASATIPTMQELSDAAVHTNIDDLIIDRQNSTVFLKDAQMSLDVGAIAKGFAAQKAVDCAKKQGLDSGIINAGGNVVAVGIPMDGRDYWGVGSRQPGAIDETVMGGSDEVFDAVKARDSSVVTSGDYQRFYTAMGKRYAHIIDPETCMPAERYRAVSVLHSESKIADMLSTALFILPQEAGEKLAADFEANALWIYGDGSCKMTEGYKKVSMNYYS